MSNESPIVWLRCKNCLSLMRLVVYSDKWSRCVRARTIASFIDEHIEHCYALARPIDDETFFDLVSFADMAKIINGPTEKSAEETPSGEETAG